MNDEQRQRDFEAPDGEVLPAREVMSVISTDPSEAFFGSPGDVSIQPIEEPGDEERTLPVEPPAA